LGNRLIVRVERQVDAKGTVMGWYLAVYRIPATTESRNLLYHSLAWHGPYPTDLLAWIHQRDYYPDDRTLPVYGWPYELHLRCRSCETAGDSTAVHFTAGTVEVGWRRLSRANPPPDR
jgi:hypothetical protein